MYNVASPAGQTLPVYVLSGWHPQSPMSWFLCPGEQGIEETTMPPTVLPVICSISEYGRMGL